MIKAALVLALLLNTTTNVLALEDPPKPYYETAVTDEATAINIIDSDGVPQPYYSESHALVIGEVNYQNGWDNLSRIPGELKKLTKGLEHQRFKVEVHFDLPSDAIVSVIERFMRKYATRPDSRLIVYLSGHGYSRKMVNYKVGYFVPVDALHPDQAEEHNVAQKLIPLSMFAGWAEMPDAKHALFIFDSCFSGAFFGFEGDPALAQFSSPYSLQAQAGKAAFPMNAAGEWIYEPTERQGIDAPYFAPTQSRLKARMFLTAGTGTDIAPASSVMTDLFSDILLERNTELIGFSRWTTFGEIGSYLVSQTPPRISQKLGPEKVAFPLFRYLPNDKFYSQGSMVFFRDRSALEIVASNDDIEESWKNVYNSNTSFESFVLKDEKLKFSQLILGYKSAISNNKIEAELNKLKQNGTFPMNALLLSELVPESTVQLGDDMMSRGAQIAAIVEIAKNDLTPAGKTVLQEANKIFEKQETANQAVRVAKLENNRWLSSDMYVSAESVPDVAKIDKYRKITASMISDDTTTRRRSRIELRQSLLAEDAFDRGELITLLSKQLAGKSYRYQIGLGVALAGQDLQIFETDAVMSAKEIHSALSVAKKMPHDEGKELVSRLQSAKVAVCRNVQVSDPNCS